MKNWIEI